MQNSGTCYSDQGVPEKSRRCLAPVFCTDVNLFYSIPFLTSLKSSVGGVGAQQLWMGLLPSTIVIMIRMRFQPRTMKSSSIPCWEVNYWGSVVTITMEELSWNWQNWQIKWIKPITMSISSIQESSVFCICEYFCCISFQFPVWCQQHECNKVTAECFGAFKFDSCQTWVWKFPPDS